MNQEEIVGVLQEKYAIDKSNYRIGLNGEWGIGKSFAWELFNKKIEGKEKTDNRLKVIYCSLFGIENIDSLKRELKRKKLEQDESFGKVITTGKHPALKMVGDALSNKFLGSTIDLLELVSLEFGSDYLICFDDLERTSDCVQISDVMGVIEQVAQSSKVLVVYNDLEMRGKSKDFQRQKEKILDIEYTLDSLSENVIEQIIQEKIVLVEEKETLTKFFLEHGKNNLRTLKKLTSYIKELKGKVPLNAELIKLCAAVFLEETLNKSEEKKLTVEEKSKAELNPLLVYQRYKINYRAFSLLDHIKNYLVTNKIDKTLFEAFVNPAEKSKIVLLMDQFHEGILSNEEGIEQTVSESIQLLKYGRINELSENYIILLVADMKYYDKLFNLNLVPGNIDDVALERIKELLKQNVIHRDISIGRFNRFNSFFQKLSIGKETLPLVQNLLSKSKQYEEQLIKQLYSKEFKRKFEEEDYDDCEIILSKNLDFLANHLYIFDKLVQPCSSDYFNFIRNILENTTIDSVVKKQIRQALFGLKRKQKDNVTVYRISLIIKEFLNVAYGKAKKINLSIM